MSKRNFEFRNNFIFNCVFSLINTALVFSVRNPQIMLFIAFSLLYEPVEAHDANEFCHNNCQRIYRANSSPRRSQIIEECVDNCLLARAP